MLRVIACSFGKKIDISLYSNNELILLDEKIGMIRLHQNCDLQGKRSHRGIDQNIRRTKFKTSHTHVLSKSYE